MWFRRHPMMTYLLLTFAGLGYGWVLTAPSPKGVDIYDYDTFLEDVEAGRVPYQSREDFDRRTSRRTTEDWRAFEEAAESQDPVRAATTQPSTGPSAPRRK